MKIALVHNALLPMRAYGGTERVVWWLAKGLNEMGVEVTLVCAPGSSCPFGRVVTVDFSRPVEEQLEFVHLFHFFHSPSVAPSRPYLVTVGGNGKPGETYLPNTAFVSGNHAARHGAECFVYNGIDPEEYEFRDRKEDYLLFLAKASWQVKNVRGAIRIAKKTRHPLRIVGGKKFFFNGMGKVHWEGMLGGAEKASIIAGSKGLLFPVQWQEPFGISIVEALISGTPVLGSPYGSLPELIDSEVGRICRSEEEFRGAVEILPQFSARRCREYALERFHYSKMARSYQYLYERVLAGEKLNARIPRATEPAEQRYPIPDRLS